MIYNILKRNMSQSIKVLANAETAEKRLVDLRNKVRLDIKCTR